MRTMHFSLGGNDASFDQPLVAPAFKRPATICSRCVRSRLHPEAADDLWPVAP